MEVRQFPPVKDNWTIKPFQMVLEHEIDYEVSLTKQIADEPDWCEVAIVVQKKYEDYEDGLIFEGTVLTVFRAKNKKKEITAELLFDLLKIAGLNFAKAFAELVKGTSLEGTKIAKPEFDYYKRYLGRVIQNS
jgi:hypothetical protein